MSLNPLKQKSCKSHRLCLLAEMLVLVMLICGCVTPPAKPAVAGAPTQGAASGSSSGATSASTPGASAKPSFKLSRVGVSWLDNFGLPVLLPGGARGTAGNGDVTVALAALRVSVPRDVTAALKAKQIITLSDGGNESLMLMPVGALVDASGATTGVIIRATVTQRASGAQWHKDIELGDRRGAIISKPALRADAASAAFSNALLNALQQAGLL